MHSQVFADPSSASGVKIIFGSLIDNRKKISPVTVAMVFGLIIL
jgi:hypothetical protein